MPEASMDKDRDAMLRQDDIWLPWEILGMQSKPVSERMELGADPHLRLGVPSAYRSHITTALLSRMDIDHL